MRAGHGDEKCISGDSDVPWRRECAGSKIGGCPKLPSRTSNGANVSGREIDSANRMISRVGDEQEIAKKDHALWRVEAGFARCSVGEASASSSDMLDSQYTALVSEPADQHSMMPTVGYRETAFGIDRNLSGIPEPPRSDGRHIRRRALGIS